MLGRLQDVHVLLVDDHDDLRELVSMTLTREGARVTEADSVRAAVTIIARGQVSLLLSDIGMPGDDGYDLIRRVRASELLGRSRKTPAVAVTGFSDVRTKVLAAGYQECLLKPVDHAQLVDVVERLARPALPTE